MITYDLQKKRVRQVLGTAFSSFYDLEGSYEDVFQRLKGLKKHYEERFVENAAILTERYDYKDYGLYIDGTKEKTVRFDTLILDCRPKDHEEGYELVVIGERNMLPEELEAMKENQEKERLKTEEQELREFERLKKKLGK